MTRGRYAFTLSLYLCGLTAGAAAPPQVAPPPRPVPTTQQELIVGTWKLVKHSHVSVLEDSRTTYDAKGKYMTRQMAEGELRVIDGTYKIIDSTLHEATDPSSIGMVRTGEHRITTLTRDVLVLSGLGRFKGMVGTYERVQRNN